MAIYDLQLHVLKCLYVILHMSWMEAANELHAAADMTVDSKYTLAAKMQIVSFVMQVF